MGAKLGLSVWRENTDWGCLRTGCSGEYMDLRGMQWQKVGENCIMRSFMVRTLHQIVIVWPRQGTVVGGLCSLHGEGEKWVQRFGCKCWCQQTAWNMCIYIILFIIYLFIDAFRSWYYVALNERLIGEWWIGKEVGERGRRLIPGGTEENHENIGQNSLSPNLDLNLGPPEYDAGVLALNHKVRYRYVI
jgi:hypothetical protein